MRPSRGAKVSERSKMIYTLTLNPSLDYIMEIENLVPGTMNRAAGTHMYPGGKGINVSAVLTELGEDNTALGFIAGFTGDELEKRLRSHGLKTDFMRLKSGFTRINVKVPGSITTELNAPGPNVTKQDLDNMVTRLQQLTNNDVLIISGGIPSTLPEFTYSVILSAINEHNIVTVLDTHGMPLINALTMHPFLIKPNREECEALFSTKLVFRDDIERCAHSLQDMGARNVLISLDSEGALLLTEDGRVLSEAAPSGNVINPVGAGDSMVAGFIYGWQTTGSFDEALKYGIAAGSASAFSTALASKDDVLSIKRLL